MSDLESRDESGAARKPDVRGEPRHGRPRLVALGFLLAFAATVLTVILTGLMLRH